MTEAREWEDYLIPGTQVLRNKFTTPEMPFGQSSQVVLDRLEHQATRMRIAELRRNPIQGDLDYDHMKAIHRHIFQDVYDWAGEERTAPTVPMTKEGHAYYPAGPALTQAAEAEYAKVAASNYLKGLDRGRFVKELAERWGEINVVHSFREGNTRAQGVLLSQLCKQAGYDLNPEVFKVGMPLREEFIQARYHSQDTGDNSRLATVLDKAIANPQNNEKLKSVVDLVKVAFGREPQNPTKGTASTTRPAHQRHTGEKTRSQSAGIGD